jgi:hypothetical protein
MREYSEEGAGSSMRGKSSGWKSTVAQGDQDIDNELMDTMLER